MAASRITLTWYPDYTAYRPDDYLQLVGDNGTGTLDTDSPILERVEIYVGGSGAYGRGYGPRGMYPRGMAAAVRLPGRGWYPRGMGPRGYGCVPVEVSTTVDTCGAYQFALLAYDAAGNKKTDTPEIKSVSVHLTPDPPAPFKTHSYDTETSTLTLTA